MKRILSVLLAIAGCGGGGGSDIEETPVLGSREAPVSVGVEYGYTDGQFFTVVSSLANANAIIAEENRFNDPPAPGMQFFLARVRTRNGGAALMEADPGFELNALGSRGQGYNFSNDCGVTPDDCRSTDLAPGGSFECNLCWQIGSEEVGTMLMYRRNAALLSETGEPFFFDLEP